MQSRGYDGSTRTGGAVQYLWPAFQAVLYQMIQIHNEHNLSPKSRPCYWLSTDDVQVQLELSLSFKFWQLVDTASSPS